MRLLVEAEELDAIVAGIDATALSDSPDMLLPTDQYTPDSSIVPVIEPSHIFQLWQVFLERVNPLSKVIHVPTVQPMVVKGVSDLDNLPLEQQALLLSMCSIAVVSLSNNECNSLLGMSWKSAFELFSTAAKAALKEINIIRNHNMVILQALLLYPVSVSSLSSLSWTPTQCTPRDV